MFVVLLPAGSEIRDRALSQLAPAPIGQSGNLNLHLLSRDWPDNCQS